MIAAGASAPAALRLSGRTRQVQWVLAAGVTELTPLTDDLMI
jgi:hypothetical protein